jgi:ADP-ribosylglycohydrolase
MVGNEGETMGRIPEDYVERCYAGWLGKIIGVRHGAPIEGWTYDRISKLIGEIDGYLVDYRDFAADDDSNGPMFFLRALEDYTYARDITAEQIGLTWLNYTPFEHGFYWWGGYGVSTEHTSYLNLRAGIMAPRSGSVEQNGAAVAEQIGGQIFIDAWGLVVPNDPALAAEYAQKAASVGHGGNGVYGGMFVAAAISAAFAAGNVGEVLDRALAVIPEDCEYARMAGDIRRFYESRVDDDWRKCFGYIREIWGYDRYPGACHIIPNSAVIVMSLLYSRGSFDRAINICNMAGWDTDCNVANVGSIMGVLVGLEGIDFNKWRKPINDFLAASSVVGCLNIMDLPGCVRTIARLAYKIAGEQWSSRWDGFLGEEASRFAFELPGCTQAFRMEGAKETLLMHDGTAQRSGLGCLKALYIGVGCGNQLRLYHRTYYRPGHFHDSRYDPAFSPILYPGQTVSAWVMSDAGVRLKAALYVQDGNTDKTLAGEAVELTGGKWTKLVYKIPPLSGACIEQAGVLLTVLDERNGEALVYLDDMNFSGDPHYVLDFSRERVEDWSGLHKEISQMTRLKGQWALEDGCLSGSCVDFGEAYTGDIAWRDYETTCTFAPMTEGLAGFNFRVQGAIRGYSLAHENGTLLLQKNCNGYTTLAAIPYEWPKGEIRTFTARALGDELNILENGNVILAARDGCDPYLTGMVGLRVEREGHVRCRSIGVGPLEA